MRPAPTLRLAALAVAASAALASAQPTPAPAPSLRLRMLAAEDARDGSPQGIAPLIDGLKSSDAELRRVAVRALGRLERPHLRPHIVALLKDPEASVRAEAADALAQSHQIDGDARAIGDLARDLADALRAETHPLVRGALAASIARLRHPDDAAGEAIGMLVLDVAFPKNDRGERRPASAAVLVGALRGLHAVALAGRSGAPRRDAAGRPVTWLPEDARAPLVALILAPPAAGPGAAFTAAETTMRRLAMQALAGRRRPDPALGLALVDDADEQVRAIAIRWAVETLKDDEARAATAADWARRRGLDETAARAWVRTRVALLEERIGGDPAAQVRFEAIRALVAAGLGPPACRRVIAAFDDRDVNVARHALTNARLGCGDDVAARARLDALSAPTEKEPATTSWHRQAYALVGYAQIDAAAARPRVLAGLRSGNAWARRYAAVASEAALKATSAREAGGDPLWTEVARLVDDPDANVATEAVRVLAHLRDEARPHLVRALRRDEEELLIEAERALRPPAAAENPSRIDRAPDAEVADACGEALGRLTAKRRETSRDPRLALVECLERTGTAAHVPRLRALLTDFDPRVAERAARALAAIAPGNSTEGAATAPAAPSPVPLPRLPLPTDADLARMTAARVVLTIRGRGEIVIRLRPDEAPLNAFRFLRLVESGSYTGLTLHRIAPAFVVQGGSPLGNEYSGDGPFTRDEVGRLANLRGSVGLSTRGRDTGDAQFYVNLADNVRLDHTYTVFAQVEAGMDVVDALVEGDAIEKVGVR